MLKAYLQLSKLDFNKEIMLKGRKKISKSFVKAFITILGRQFAQSVSYATNNIYGSSISETTQSIPLLCNSGGGGGQWNAATSSPSTSSDFSVFGLVVGTDQTAVTPTDDSLGSQIVHGTGAGQLEYFGTLVSPVIVSAPDASFNIERIFRNSSGGNIAIGEIGLYGSHYSSGSLYQTYCLIRDALVATVTVLNTEYLKVQYSIKITV